MIEMYVFILILFSVIRFQLGLYHRYKRTLCKRHRFHLFPGNSTASCTLTLNDNCVFVGESTLTWLSARADCKRRGGDLLIVDQLVDMFEILPYIRTKRNHWIGAFNHVWQFQSGIVVLFAISCFSKLFFCFVFYLVVVVVMSGIHPVSGSIDIFLSSDATGCKNVLSASIIEKLKRI